MTSDAQRRLRTATDADHRRLEARLDIFEAVNSRAGRCALVQRFHGLHVAAEAATAPWLADMAGLDFEVRRRSGLLEQDLTALGAAPSSLDHPPIHVGGVGEALGLMYVVEGSALGGQVIRRRIVAGGGDLTGLGFLDPYGRRLGERWRAFLRVLDEAAAVPAVGDAMQAGAVAGFRHAEARLCAEVADA